MFPSVLAAARSLPIVTKYVIVRRTGSGRHLFVDEGLGLHVHHDKAERVSRETAATIIRYVPDTMYVTEEDAVLLDQVFQALDA